MSVIAKNSLQYYVVDSNEALEFKMVRRPEDLEDDEVTFKPDMSHQVYGDSEQIFGYSGLQVKLYYSAGRLTTYLAHTYADKVHPDKFEGIKPDEVIKPIAEKIPPGYLTNLEDFTAILQKDASFVPFGDLERRFTARTEEGKEKTFEVYRCCASTPGFLPYHEHFQTFILWYIDAASYIDVDDEKWRFFVTYEKYEVEGRQQYAFAGYTTVYEYYAYPANVRPRISQMLVLPPFQRLGLGAEMLNTIYSNYQSDARVLDITVEDPSDNFARLRDFVDAKNCLTLDSFDKAKLYEGFSAAMVEEAKKKLKLNKVQCILTMEVVWVETP
ncbi:Histone acetyltransferase type B catalytic subunit [Chionoecetes opilio]|uniref:Histone acetyltransferase type B catalytic subunit n=1 Tax=Chionoecetes opilio TaxID=41210 RepID=A0A8J4XY87_CHIOP|nr:Histone acetyltransferase type B catalytic subunit [Chionoecetes opilio]